MQDYNTSGSLVSKIKDFNPSKEPVKIELSYWKKGMKIPCPKCGMNMSPQYVCCGIRFKPFVKMEF